MTSTLTPMDKANRTALRARLLANLFNRLRYRVKAPCLKCARPFLIETADGKPSRDNLPYCPACLPRRAEPRETRAHRSEVRNSAEVCDCGSPAIIVVYITIHQPGVPKGALTPFALCEVCAVDELISSLKLVLP